MCPDCATRKQRDAFYTSRRIAPFISKWAIRGKRDKVLDPETGEGIFLVEAYKRLKQLGLGHDIFCRIFGAELDASDAKIASKSVRELGATEAHIINSSFFDTKPPTLLALESRSIPLVEATMISPKSITVKKKSSCWLHTWQ